MTATPLSCRVMTRQQLSAGSALKGGGAKGNSTLMAAIREYAEKDARKAAEIWNSIVEEGAAFPQMEALSEREAHEFFSAQSFTGVAEEAGEVAGLYILHPNNVGRCGHICNASYAVRSCLRGRGIGELLARHSLTKGKELGFRIMQFNAVVATNKAALRLYERLGFARLGAIPGGFLMKDGRYEDIILHYKEL